MDTLKTTVRRVLEGFASKADNEHRHLAIGPAEDVFTMVDVEHSNGQRFVMISLVIRIAGELVIIKRNKVGQSVQESLIEAGISAKKIVLAYAGEPIPDTTG